MESGGNLDASARAHWASRAKPPLSGAGAGESGAGAGTPHAIPPPMGVASLESPGSVGSRREFLH